MRLQYHTAEMNQIKLLLIGGICISGYGVAIILTGVPVYFIFIKLTKPECIRKILSEFSSVVSCLIGSNLFLAFSSAVASLD